jgi:hypothetical protein
MGVAKADFTFGTPINLGPIVNSPDVDWMPSLSADGLTHYFGSRRSGGFGAEDIYVTTRETTTDPWEEPLNLGPPVNTSNWEQGPSISTDGLTLFFSSYNRPGGSGGDDIYVTTRATTDDPWSTPVNLGSKVNSSAHDWAPSISADGLELFFGSTRSGGYGGYDLWVTTRETIHDEWGSPVNLGGTVNSAHKTHGMSISHDGLLPFFSSNRPGGYGGFDFWVTRRKTINDPWGTPLNLGLPINSSAVYDQTPNISADGSTLHFTTERIGDVGEGDIYQSPIIPIFDLNGDSIVDAADMCIVVDNWGTDNKLCDIGPMPWGDGVVDVQDLIVLSEHLFEENFPVELIEYWKLDEAEGDIAYNNIGDNDGILNGDPTWQPDSGQVAGALEFDGINDYVETGFVLDPAGGAFSAFTWIKGGATGQVIISQSDGNGTGEIWLSADALSGNLMTGLRPPGGRSPTLPMVSDFVITDGQWHHVGIVVTPYGVRSLYADGMRVTFDTQGVSLPSSNGGMYIGADKNPDTTSFFSGLIDDVRIYDVALSTKEIEVLTRY